MKFICISDTHNLIPDITGCEGDAIIHCGDISLGGSKQEIYNFFRWYSALPFKYKIIVPGNHDFWFEEEKNCRELTSKMGIMCLVGTACYIPKPCGSIINIWGSPVTPKFHDWAFNKTRGDDIQKHWNLIPDNLDILITHGPPAKIGNLSITVNGIDIGCENLKSTIIKKKPKYHLFGHNHEGYGQYIEESTTYINCSSLTRYYKNSNSPVIIEL